MTKGRPSFGTSNSVFYHFRYSVWDARTGRQEGQRLHLLCLLGGAFARVPFISRLFRTVFKVPMS